MAALAPLLSLLTLIISWFWGARCARRCSTLAFRATRKEKAPERWQSRQAELEAEVASLSSTCEKVLQVARRLNSREGMREFRAAKEVDRDTPPPVGCTKAELRAWYERKSGKPLNARLTMVPNNQE